MKLTFTKTEPKCAIECLVCQQRGFTNKAQHEVNVKWPGGIPATNYRAFLCTPHARELELKRDKPEEIKVMLGLKEPVKA